VLRLGFPSRSVLAPRRNTQAVRNCLIGLGLNSAVVWLLAEILSFDPTLAEILAVFPVFAWNYLGPCWVVFDGTPSAAMALLAERARGLS
jgi:putative flippase GtrA